MKNVINADSTFTATTAGASLIKEPLSIARLEKLADTDAQTSLCNRRVMNEKADIFFDKAFSSQTSFSVEMLDIDNFKQINDTYGHQTGDQVLICLAEAMNTLTDENTIAAR